METSNANLGLGCTYLKAVHDSGPRTLIPRYIVVHCTAGPNAKHSAKDVANYFAHEIDAKTPGSAQIVVDDYECYRSLNDMVIPWAAPPFNTSGLHVELCGEAYWKYGEWIEHKATIDRAARAIAAWSIVYEIPPVWLNVERCKRRERGITSHRNVSLAFAASNHTDPGEEDGKHFPYEYLMGKVGTERYLLENGGV